MLIHFWINSSENIVSLMKSSFSDYHLSIFIISSHFKNSCFFFFSWWTNFFLFFRLLFQPLVLVSKHYSSPAFINLVFDSDFENDLLFKLLLNIIVQMIDDQLETRVSLIKLNLEIDFYIPCFEYLFSIFLRIYRLKSDLFISLFRYLEVPTLVYSILLFIRVYVFHVNICEIVEKIHEFLNSLICDETVSLECALKSFNCVRFHQCFYSHLPVYCIIFFQCLSKYSEKNQYEISLEDAKHSFVYYFQYIRWHQQFCWF